MGPRTRLLLTLLGVAGLAAAALGLLLDADGFAGNLVSEVSGILIGAALTAFIIEKTQEYDRNRRDMLETGYELALRTAWTANAIESTFLGTSSEAWHGVQHPAESGPLIRCLIERLQAHRGRLSDDDRLYVLRNCQGNLLGMKRACIRVIAGSDLRDRATVYGELDELYNEVDIPYGADEVREVPAVILKLLRKLCDLNERAAPHMPRP